MLVLDGIIFSLQRNGGISVYFSELWQRVASLNVEAMLLMFGDNEASSLCRQDSMRQNMSPRFLERYRNVAVKGSGVFHSSYYRNTTTFSHANITTVYDFTYEKYMKAPSRWLHSWQKFRSIRNSDAILCISENTKSDLCEYLPDISADRIFVTPLAANEAFRSDSSPGTPQDYVLFVGSRVSYKNFPLLVNAMGHMPRVRLLVVGGGQFSREELALLERVLAGRYLHQGNVTVERLKDLYRGALCLVYPTAYEGFGIPVLEAMAAGCPVIAMNSSSIPEVAGDAAVLLDSPDQKDLSDAIEHVSRSDVRRELIAKGMRRAQLFSWDATFSRTRAVYETLLGRTLQ